MKEEERVLKASRRLEGEITLPGDKSLSHRAVMLNSIAVGDALITNFSPGADSHSTVTCMRALGVAIEERGGGPSPSIVVQGGGRNGLKEAGDVLDAGNSGTTMRFLAGLLAAQPFLSVLTGDASLRSRPMKRVVDPLRAMGAHIWGREGDSKAPLAIKGGGLKGIDYPLPVASAQLKSCLLLAAFYAASDTVLVEPAPSRDHTERMLQAMGAHLERQGPRIVLRPTGKDLMALSLNIPGDISSAAFWLVAGVTHPNAQIRVTNVGVNPTRSGVLEILQAMGAKISLENQHSEGGEPVADIVVRSSTLTGTEIKGEIIPRAIDEFPVIAVAATLAQGTTYIRDAAELRVKESDRIATTVRELTKMGASIEELPDGMIIHGGTGLKGARCQSYGDHRLAMALGVAGLLAEGETVIEGAQAVGVSYPGFWQVMERLAVG